MKQLFKFLDWIFDLDLSHPQRLSSSGSPDADLAVSSPARPAGDPTTDASPPSEPPATARDRLLLAAGPVFAASGFEGATVREICAAAEVNIASVGYYFGDKLGLYREVIQRIRDDREERFPPPDEASLAAEEVLCGLIRTILSRILADGPLGWESQLFVREMQSPTPVFESIVLEFFQPLFDRLKNSLRDLLPAETAQYRIEHMALSVVGQCVYYRVGGRVIELLIPNERRQQHFDIETICSHVTSVVLAAIKEHHV